MKISIITPAWNAADTICDTIASVIDQTYNDVEYILVDRASTDERLPIFLSMRHSMDINHTKHISENITDVFKAIEKGVEIATGDIIGILGAGDFYSSDDVISSVMEEFSTGKVQMVYGDMKFVDYDNTLKVTRRTCGRFYRRWPKTSGMTKCHPALFITKELFLKSGGFRHDFKLAADYEMMVRLLSDRDHVRKYLRKEMVSIRQDKVNSAEAEAYRKELVKAFEVNDHPHSDKGTTDVEHHTAQKSKTKAEVTVEVTVEVVAEAGNETVEDKNKKSAAVKSAAAKSTAAKSALAKPTDKPDTSNLRLKDSSKKTSKHNVQKKSVSSGQRDKVKENGLTDTDSSKDLTGKKRKSAKRKKRANRVQVETTPVITSSNNPQ